MRRFGQRQGFLVSAAVHLTLLMVLIAHPPTPHGRPVELANVERKDVVFLPPGAVLRKLVPLQPKAPTRVPVPRPTPQPTPPPAARKDRISVGPPSELRAKGPMILRKDEDLTKVARGVPTAPTAPVGTPAPTPPPDTRQAASPAVERPGRQGLRLPPGLLGPGISGEEGQRPREGRPGGLDRSVQNAVEEMARRMQQDARRGIPTGTGQNLGGLYFDPQGADFTAWIQRFKDEVYRNWIVPQSVLLGAARGHVDFEFVVERDGSVSSLRLLKSSGTASLDRAAQNALTSSRYLPLPDDYGPPRITMQVGFFYNENPQGS